MAVTFDSASSGQSVAATTLTVSHTCTGANGILIVQAEVNGQFTTGITYNGVSMTLLLQDKDGGGGGSGTGVYYLINPATGTHDIVASLSLGFIVLTAASYAGVLQSSFPNTSSKEDYPADNGATQSNTITPGVDNCWVVGGAFVNANAATTGGTGTTVRASNSNASGGLGIGDNNATISPAASTTLNFASSSGGRFGWIAAMAPAVAAGPTNLKSYNGNLKANIKSMNGNLIANVKSFDGNA